MAETSYTRSISGDFLGYLDRRKFREDIAASDIAPTLVWLDESEDENGVVDFNGCEIIFDDPITAGEETTLDATIATHALAIAKARKFIAIDARTDQLIAEGFTYSAKQFSITLSAQNKIMGSHQIRAGLSYPLSWNTLDDNDSYDIVDIADLEAFYLAAFAELRGHLDSGTALKASVRAAADVAAVDAVVDGR
jgi:hypothetical protein